MGLSRIISWLPEPSAQLTDPEDRVRAAVLSGLLFVCIPLGFLTVLIQLFVVEDFLPTFITNTVGLSVLLALAVLSQTKWYRPAAISSMLVIVGIAATAGLNNPDDPVWWAYEVLAVLLATLFVSVRAASLVALFALFATGAVLVHNGFVPERDLAPLMYHVVFGPALVVLAYLRDLLEKRRRRELDRNRGLLEQAEEIAKVGHWEWNGTDVELSRGLQRILRAEACVSVEEFSSAFQPEDRPRLERLVRGEVPGGKMDLVLTTPEGEERYATVSVESEAAIVGTVQDLTERRLAEQEHGQLQRQVLEAQRLELVGRIAGGIAHDFNNLLTVVQAAAEFIEECEPAERGQYLDELEVSLGRGAGLTRQLLAYARKQVLEPRELAIAEIVEQMRPILERLVGRKVLEVVVEDDARAALVHVDRSQLEQVLLNLVLNACEAIEGDEGEIAVRLATTDERVVLEVFDDGAGLDPSVGDKIFEPFFTVGKAEGTGLGLATVYGIVHQSGGTIEFESEAGEGTTFRVHLPLAVPTVDAAASSESLARPRTTLIGVKFRVLVVDDEPMVLRYVSRLLSKKGFEIETAGGVVEARELWAKDADRFDMLISDVVMPDGSGIEMATEFLERHEVPVVLMSGYSEDLVEPGVPMRFSGFVKKPFTIDELMDAVDPARRLQKM